MAYQEQKVLGKEDKEVTWRHPGGKLRRLGPASLTDAELLAVIIGTGSGGKSAEEIAEDIVNQHFSLPGLMGKSIRELMDIKGMKEVKASKLPPSLKWRGESLKLLKGDKHVRI